MGVIYCGRDILKPSVYLCRMNRKKIFNILKWVLIVYCGIGIILYYVQEKILLHPKPLNRNHVFIFNQKFEEVNIPFNKTDTVNMIRFTSADSVTKGIVLYFHGNKNNVEHYAKFVPAFTKHGYEVWMPDYPGFGKSTGELSEQKLYSIAYEIRKMAAGKYGADSIVIYGKSLGTAIAAYAATVKPCRQLILETPYYSIPSLFNSYAFMYPAKIMSNYKLPTYQFLQDVEVPVTIFHGTGDWVVPYRSGVKLKKFLKPGDQFIKIEDGEHNNLSESVVYTSALDSLLEN
ncbi:MAG: alpha/beta fold hydrolase [Sphingobacteriales bacterium]|nr:MAG: alpha/beta fold hydrolase [Sphingobacteriales bacterium]